jgi:hypothetical protein
MGKKFIIETTVTYRQEVDIDDWEISDQLPKNPTPEDLLRNIQKWAPTAEGYFAEAEIAEFESPSKFHIVIIDPDLGVSVDFPDDSDENEEGDGE